ncbi:MAG: glycosyltransferase family 4 protein [Candidatus Aminicenantes bacterium]|nr:glycosyltransferase family 4 protein [Candidatus Aminicenantes bacterium]
MNQKKTVIHLVHLSSHPGGIEVLLPEMIRNISDYHFQVFVIRPPVPGEVNVYQNIHTQVKYGSRKNIAAFYKIFSYAKKYRQNIFHVFNIGPFFLFLLRLAGVKKLIYSIHGTVYWKNRRQRVLRKVLWKAATNKKFLLTSNSLFSGKVFKEKVLSRQDIQLLYNPINVKRFGPDKEKVRILSPKKIIYCGRLAKGKNLKKWIELADFLKHYFSDAIFEIYGDGPEKENLQKLIQSKKLGEAVQLRGYVDQIERIYQNADVMIFLSEYESFGNVVVESILCGTPVIASAIPSMKEIFRDSPDFLVELNENLETNVLIKLKDLKKLNQLALSARASFSERFSPEKHYEKLRDIYASFQN